MAAGFSSSYSDRISRDYERQYGRPADANDPQYAAYIKTALPSMIQSDKDALAKSQGRWNTVRKVAFGAAALPFAAAAAPLFAGGAAASSAGAGAAVGGGATGAGMTFGNLLQLGQLGAGLGTQLYANRVNGRAANQQAVQQQNEFAQQMALLQQQNAQAQKQWEAEQAQKAQDYALALDDRNRRIKLEDDKEARRQQYRTQLGDPATMRLRDLLGLGR